MARARDVTARAAVALAYADRPAEAALAVETGRAVVLSEALGIEQARILDTRRARHPLLIRAYEAGRGRGSPPAAGSGRCGWPPSALIPGQTGLEDQAELRAARQALDDAIGALEQAMGVELLRPPTPKSLRAVVRAAGLPVVYLVASEIGGCAIIVEPDGNVRPSGFRP